MQFLCQYYNNKCQENFRVPVPKPRENKVALLLSKSAVIVEAQENFCLGTASCVEVAPWG
jgi:hypothetical protein